MLADVISVTLISVISNGLTLPLDYMKVQTQIRSITKVKGGSLLKSTVNRGVIGFDALVATTVAYTILRTKIFSKFLSCDSGNATLKSALVGGVSGFITSPFDLILLRKQADNTLEKPRNYGGFRASLSSIIAEGGYAGLYTGSLPNSLKYGMLALGFYPTFEAFGGFSQNSSRVIALIPATIVGCSLSLPFDYVKTKIQRQTGGEFKNSVECLVKTFSSDFRGVYSGFGFYFARTYINLLLISSLVAQMDIEL